MRVRNGDRQREINEKLRPWLDCAALLPCKSAAPWPALVDTTTIERVFNDGASPEKDDRNPGLLRFTKFPASELFRYRLVIEKDHGASTDAQIPGESLVPIVLGNSWDRTAAAKVFYSLFFYVRWILEQIALEGAHQKSRQLQGRPIRYDTSISFPFFGFPQRVEIRSDGICHLGDEPVWSSFKQAVDGVDCQRLRRCPECGRVYYAVRFNKQACDQHLALAAVKRAQKKRTGYENNRKANRLVKQKGVSVGKALQQSRRTSRRKRRNNDGESV